MCCFISGTKKKNCTFLLLLECRMRILRHLCDLARWLRLQGLPAGTLAVQVSSLPAAVRQKPVACREKSCTLYSPFKMKMPSGSGRTAAAFMLIPLASAEPFKAATSGQLASPSFFFCGRFRVAGFSCSPVLLQPEGMGSVLESLGAADLGLA